VGRGLSITQAILGRNDPPNWRGETRVERLSKRIFKFPAFLASDEVAVLRSGIFHQQANEPADLEESWAATRYQTFNNQIALLYVERAQRLIGQCINKAVRFSYNYNAIYPSDARLTRHTDRDECDYNLLLYLGQDTPSNRQVFIIEIEDGKYRRDIWGIPGDAVLFEGRTMMHGRPLPIPTQNFMTTLLHFVEL